MREIKFRAWDKKEKKMFLFVCQIDWMSDYKTITVMEGSNRLDHVFYPSEIPLEHVELMQFTGLRDKSGKEIYEGDIIKTNSFYPSEVIYDNTKAVFKIRNGWDLQNFVSGIEVIGNVWQNPELVGGCDEA